MSILTPDRVRIHSGSATQEEALQEAAGLLQAAGAVTPAYLDAMRQREQTVSTFMGNGLAIPHGTNEAKDAIKRSALSVVRYDTALDWDGNEVRFAVGVAGVDNGHLEILGKIAIVFSDADEVDRLLAAGSAEELYQLLSEVNED
jgi:PTS system mannitol-specific IIA component